MNREKVWLVTGASKGLGLVLVQQLLAGGYKVAATSRTTPALTAAVGGEYGDRFLPLEVSLTSEQSVQDAVNKTIAAFGAIDVVVNNAGYGQIGTLEELSDAEARSNFDINVFGLLNVIRHTMPHLRAQQSGHIFNIASVGGYTGNFPGWGIYCATKFAVAGLTESLAAEVKPFGVHATVVYPGYFRTDFLSKDSIAVAAQPIAAYEAARESQRMHEEDINGRQQGDPLKAAAVMIRVAASAQPPVHLFLGQDAYDMAELKNGLIQADMLAWQKEGTATGFAV
ncbi:SDR family oxidoreductase [Taibaiella chishuiensis]|uniref:Short-subunit dehydrogenase n=1 Tax=Taibaiella chishuiensis TaxID=1434707 RepID=A0A2P8CVZ8_9BACT|nr:SDR family oxidoreductase [Taibaiella chishuiensis]PSK89125.1 short-subunit dehydrogenase [Taibaiella chishuiensis]